MNLLPKTSKHDGLLHFGDEDGIFLRLAYKPTSADAVPYDVTNERTERTKQNERTKRHERTILPILLLIFAYTILLLIFA